MARGQHQTIGIDWMPAACALNPGHFQTQRRLFAAGPVAADPAEQKADFYRTADGRWFFPIGSYPHLRDGVLDLLQCANTAEALDAAIGRRGSGGAGRRPSRTASCRASTRGRGMNGWRIRKAQCWRGRR